MTVNAFDSKRPLCLPSRSVLLMGLLASLSGACSAPGGGAAGTVDGSVDANSGSGEASPGTESSSSDGLDSSISRTDVGSGGDSSSASDSQAPTDSSSVSDSQPRADSSSSTDGGTVCPLPTTFHWTSTGPLAPPKSGWLALKDFSDVVFNNQHIVYMSTVNTSQGYGMAMMTPFTDWSQMDTATQHTAPGGAAPTLIYFTPKNIWVLMFEWGSCSFSYVTSTDPTNPSGWSPEHCLYEGNSLDETVVCNSTTCYLFFADDDGSIYRASMPIGDFPGQFYNPTTVLSDSKFNLFEADEVYTVKGPTLQYLMIVEAVGSGRYFRSFTATDLGGSWSPLAATESNPFAGKANVTFSGTAWTNDISSGDLVRDNPDETQTIDPCNLQFLYQGDAPTSGLGYNQLPWQPGLLTLVQ